MPIILVTMLIWVLYAGLKKNKALGVIGGIFVIICVVLLLGKAEILKQAHFCRVDTSKVQDVSTQGAFILSAGSSVMLKEEYIVSDFDKKSIKDWCKGRKHIEIDIKDKDKLLWVGKLPDKDMVGYIEKVYTMWSESGQVPKDKMRCWFLCFYLDKEFDKDG